MPQPEYIRTPSCLITSASAAVGGPIEAAQGSVQRQLDIYNAGSGAGVDHRYILWGDVRGDITLATLITSGWTSDASGEDVWTTNDVLPLDGVMASGVEVAISYGGQELFSFYPCTEMPMNVIPVVKAGVVFPTLAMNFKVWGDETP